jgi:hypothetical protein
MKTFAEITNNKPFRSLTAEQRNEIQELQTHLVLAWQDETDANKKDIIFNELFATLEGMINGVSAKYTRNSYSVEFEEFVGLMQLTLVETAISFDRTMDKPFTPVFLQQFSNDVKMMYRGKGYDLHDTTLFVESRLDRLQDNETGETRGDLLPEEVNAIDQIECHMIVEELLEELFGDNDQKKTMVHMAIQDFKRSEIVSAVKEAGKSIASVERQVNRTVNDFKQAYTTLV